MALFGLPDGEGNSWFGQLFVMACYGFLLFKAAVIIGDGSEKLLTLYGPGIVGGLVIPILGAVPDGAIVLVSGLGARSVAQCQVSTGVGTLAGSTIMLLTIPWALSLFLGARDRDERGMAASHPSGKPKYEDGFRWRTSCVTTYKNTTYGARIMMLTTIPYLIVLIPAIIEHGAPAETQIKDEHYPALVGFIVCAVAFFAYSLFQVFDSNRRTAQEMKQFDAKYKRWAQAVGKKIASTDNAIKMKFEEFDTDKSGKIDKAELQQGFKDLGLVLDRPQINKLMEEFNVDDDSETLTEDEFCNAVKKWSRIGLRQQSSKALGDIQVTRRASTRASAVNVQVPLVQVDAADRESSPLVPKHSGKHTYQSVADADPDAQQALPTSKAAASSHEDLLQDFWNDANIEQEEEDEEDMFLHLTDCQLTAWAIAELLFGTFMCCIFSDPMVGTIGNFSDTLGVSSFFVSFIVTPIASNAAEIYSALMFARKKTKKGISMGFSALYGAACMNSTFVLCIFCALIFFRQLEWTFVTETLVILLTMIVVGINGLKETVTVWQGFLVITLFPLSLLLVAVLDPLLDDTTPC